jgi:ribose transport system substrate-binding protein
MLSVLGGHGEVALVGGYSVGSTLRLSGFTRGVAGTQIRIVARADAGYDRGRAQLAACRILRDHPNVAGFFAANDVMALGIADAAQAAHKRDAVEVIGRAVSVRDGTNGREACIAAARGAKLSARVNTPIVLVTKKNVAEADAAFPMPPRPYADPYERLLHGHR